MQKVVRTYSNGWTKKTECLERYLNEGFIVKHITPFTNEKGKIDFVEYIIEK